MMYLVDDLLEVHCNTGTLQVAMVGGVVDELSHFVEAKLRISNQGHCI